MNCTPDIIDRINSFSKTKLQDFQRIQELIDIMKSRSEIELKYSESLQTLAEKLSKLVEGKNEQIKNSFGTLESYFAIHADLSKNLSTQINSDIIPALLNYIKDEKEVMKNMETTGKQCEKNLNEVMETYDKTRTQYMKANYQMNYSLREKKKKENQLKQDIIGKELLQKHSIYYELDKQKKDILLEKLKEEIQKYNEFVDQYFTKIANLNEECEKDIAGFYQSVKDSIMKLVVYEVSMIRSLQYDVERITKKLEASQIQNGTLFLFKEEPHESKILLNKINFENYIKFLNNDQKFFNNAPEFSSKKEQIDVLKQSMNGNDSNSKTRFFSSHKPYKVDGEENDFEENCIENFDEESKEHKKEKNSSFHQNRSNKNLNLNSNTSNFDLISEKNENSKVNFLAKNLINGTSKQKIEEIFTILIDPMNRMHFINCLKSLNQSEVSCNSLRLLEEIFNFIMNEGKLNKEYNSLIEAMTIARQIFFSNYDPKNYEKAYLHEKLAIRNEIYTDSAFWLDFLKFKKDLSSKEEFSIISSGNDFLNTNSKALLNLLIILCEAGLEKKFVIKVLGEADNYFDISASDSEIIKQKILKHSVKIGLKTRKKIFEEEHHINPEGKVNKIYYQN